MDEDSKLYSFFLCLSVFVLRQDTFALHAVSGSAQKLVYNRTNCVVVYVATVDLL